MMWKKFVASVTMFAAASAVSLAATVGVANAEPVSGAHIVLADHHDDHHDGRHVGLLTGVAQGVRGLLHGVAQAARPVLHGLF
ncbi:MAG TPA: hypothetical protein VGM60_04570 [Pseudonocardia sp.]|jgi:hypothetical protein|uniref:hypothetical protein n=1 Tax=Pseudonocardia sp. TaxID=60912 RepID=UPI002F41868A